MESGECSSCCGGSDLKPEADPVSAICSTGPFCEKEEEEEGQQSCWCAGGGGGEEDKCGVRSGKFTDPKDIVPPGSLPELIAMLNEVFESDNICVDYVRELMQSYKSDRQEWERFAKFDPYKYTRNLVDEGNGKFNLMILCWNESQGSSIHSHANSHCFLKVLSGEVKEELYHWPEETSTGGTGDEEVMKKKGEVTFGKDRCTYICDELGLHRVENNSHENKTVTLHLYSPPFQECKCFDQRSGKVTTAQMTFWSKYGKRTPFAKKSSKKSCCNAPVENN